MNCLAAEKHDNDNTRRIDPDTTGPRGPSLWAHSPTAPRQHGPTGPLVALPVLEKFMTGRSRPSRQI
ncbi:unnamed protein product [Plutella xylostella]|uniref:(diamondback moth) hypothetical protein n=1 Tax=Plutella xylostella TaxID=51655 RepID=A0A8S4FIA6_PLUXY|nr:unnamed protein product [Plutella xylostella]